MAGLRFLCRLSGGLLAATLLASPAWAEAVLDGTTGSTGTFSGTFDIPAAVGRQEGGNLFHSFERFRVRRGESATFTGPGGIDNVISRVTGGEISRINGRLASSVPGADFFFLNPSGVVFGPNASLDLPGSFHVSTADELRFEDGTAFSALAGGTGTFSAAAPEAFGFLDAGAAPVTVDRARLELADDQTLSFSGGGITVDGGNAGTFSGGTAGALVTAGGRVLLTSVAGAGEAAVDGSGVSAPLGGDVRLTDQGSVVVSGEGGGAVRILGGRLVVRNQSMLSDENRGGSDATGGMTVEADRVRLRGTSSLFTSAAGDGAASRIVVRTEDLQVESGSVIGSGTTGAGDAGVVRVDAERTTLTNGGRISSDTSASGEAGAVVVVADTVEVLGGAQIRAVTFASGDAGRVDIETRDLRLDSQGLTALATAVSSSAAPNSSGDAGTVTIVADGAVEVANGGQIRSLTFGEGDAGTVAVEARLLRVRSGGQNAFPTGVLSSAEATSSGAGGTVRVSADRVRIRGGQIRSVTLSSGNAGSVEIEAGELTVRGGASGFLDGVLNTAEPGSSGDAGNIRVSADRVRIADGGRIVSDTSGPGIAGTITVEAGEVRIDGGGAGVASISSSTFGNADDAGDGGIIVVRADDIRLLGGGRIIGVTQGDGDSGAITVEAATMIIDGNRRGFFTGISSDAERALDDQGRPIPGAADATGDAGPLLVRVADLVLRDGGQIRSETGTRGDAGAVIVDSTESVEMSGGRSTSISSDAARGSSGDAGNVLVSTQTLLIGDGTRISSRTRGEGRAGQVLVVSEDGVVRGGIETTSRTLAPAGNVAFSAPRLVIEDGGLVGSSGLGDGPAGDVVLAGGELTVKDGAVRTEGREGGRINVAAGERLVLSGAEVTSNGIVPSAGDSIITVQSGTILVNSSSVTSLTGAGEPITGSGEARLLGDLTVISTDSRVAASSTLEVTGLESDLTAGVEVLPAAYIDVSGLLRESCAARAADQTSSFASEGGRALAPDPGAPLAGRYAADEAGPRATPAAFHHWTLSSVGGCDD